MKKQTHNLVPMVRKNQKSELEKFILFYEHEDDNRQKGRSPNRKIK